MPRITISYRRDDSGVITGRVFDRLVARYGRDAIFRDIDDVPFGVDFRTHIDQVLASTDVVIAVVGPNWAGPSASQSRLSNEADPVRVEIETVLRKKLPLIPVLVLSAVMPSVTQLPKNLKDFAYRNAVELDAGQNFDVGMARLIRAIDGILGLTAEAARASAGETAAVPPQPARPQRYHLMIGASITALLVVVAATGWYVSLERQKPPLPVETATVAPKATPAPTVVPTSTPPAPPVAAPVPPPIDPEMVFWQSITASTSAADFEEYLRKYPSGQFAGLARNRIAALQVPAPRPQPTVDAETALWQSISSSNNSKDYQRYLQKYPNGQYANLAQSIVNFFMINPPNSSLDSPDVIWSYKIAGGGNLELRAEPSLSSRLIRTLPPTANFILVAKRSGDWCRLRWAGDKGVYGWVRCNALARESICNECSQE
jgi:hypothetical protein